MEIRAKAGIDLDRFSEALADGRQSLQLYPENVLLLVPLANVAIHTQRAAEARRYASLALECLDRFARPASIAERDWPRIEAELRSASLTVLGRADLSEGRPGQAVPRFESALRANAGETQAAFLLGLAYLETGQRARAVAWLARVAREPGPLAARAREQLSAAGEKRDPAAIPPPGLRLLQVAKGLPASASYAGSDACRPCHEKNRNGENVPALFGGGNGRRLR